jgi:hypothetical protein
MILATPLHLRSVSTNSQFYSLSSNSAAIKAGDEAKQKLIESYSYVMW